MTGYGWGFLSGLLVGLAWWLADSALTARHRRRQRGGYVKPPASSTTSPRTGGRSTTRPTPAGSSSPPARGRLSAVAAVRLMPPPESNAGGPGWSTRVPDGGEPIGRTPPAPAASAEALAATEHPKALSGAGERLSSVPEPPGASLLRRNRGDDAA